MFDPLNKAVVVLKVPENLLTAAVARSRNDLPAALVSLTQAVADNDALNYSEPPPWYPPVRPALGALLLASKQLPEAEKVFRADLDRNPRDPRALAGLRDTLKAQGREYEALQIEQQYRDAWKTADAKTSAVR
jgi:tetratricopeptide (TPR) repeat protein